MMAERILGGPQSGVEVNGAGGSRCFGIWGHSDPSGHRCVQDLEALAWGFMSFTASVFRDLPERRLLAPGVSPITALSLFQG